MAALAVLNVNAGISKEFSFENEEFAGINLNYRMAVINPEIQSEEIVVIYLHGGSGQGNNNKSQLNSGAVEDIYNYLKDTGLHARMLVPQAPSGQQWDNNLIPALKGLADKYCATQDTRIYILGGSMGGYGVWNLLTAYPDFFAGAMPVACNTPGRPAELYSHTRICSVIGGRDTRRRVSAIESFFRHLEATDGDGAKLDIEPNWDHRRTCEDSFTRTRLNWLFKRGE